MKKGLLLLIGIVFSLNVGFTQNASAQGNRPNQQRNQKDYKRNKDFRQDERKGQRYEKHDRRYDTRYDDRYRHPKNIHKNRQKVVYSHHKPNHYKAPYWASAHKYRGRNAVYFRDYNAFYDPHRGVYVYWHNNAWVYSSTVPRYMSRYDLNRARVHYITDVPYGARPEMHYKKYARRYPRNNNIQINIALPPY